MSTPNHPDPLRLPATLESQLLGFRRRVWTIKLAEAAGIAVFAVIMAFLCVFAVDRLWDTPRWLRLLFLLAALGGCAVVPLYFHRWIWRRRRLEQLARLLSAKLPRLGDQLLGIIELAHSEGEQARSRALCEAAIRNVADDARRRDLADATPASRYRTWAWLSAALLITVLALGVTLSAAAANAWARFLTPWASIPRYTFAALEKSPHQIVVPHGEPFQVSMRLAADSLWQPRRGRAQFDNQTPVESPLNQGSYQFDLPPQISEGRLRVAIGDFRHGLRIQPVLRPELTSIVADVTLPDYLGRPQPSTEDVRGGSVSLVKGSRASFVATASRPLVSASVDGQPQSPDDSVIRSPVADVLQTRQVEFRWEDRFGLAGKEPFTLTVTASDDEAPTLACEDLPRAKVVLDSEQLNFRVKAQDDFGVKQIGIEWTAVKDAVIENPAQGDRILAAGGFEKTSVDAAGTFSARSLGIEPQPIELRVFADDYLPGRQRVYSHTCVLYILTPEQHAVWMTEQLGKWHRQSLEVRDRELQLHETNKQLRDLPADQLDQPETRRRIEDQAAAERANSRRLSNLTATGEELLRQASRNPQFDVGHLDRWAEMLQILKDIAANRMPSVADLLQEASKARVAASTKPATSGPKAGKSRASAASPPPEESPEQKSPPPAPQVVDGESSLQPPDKEPQQPSPPKAPSSPGLRLPTTTLLGAAKQGDPPPPAEETIQEAVRQQEDLLAEFEKIVNELNNILANLEGSTLVKRLKAASREQYQVAGRIGDLLDDSFGVSEAGVAPENRKVYAELASVETKSSQNVSRIMDDMEAFFHRRKFVKFQTVLEEMKTDDVVGGLRQLADEVPHEPGLSIAQCEYWWDTMDRWAEDLVDPASCGTCRGGGFQASLPPAIVLEVLQILEAEVNLREETRVAEQARPALAGQDYAKRAKELSSTQDALEERIVKVNGQIQDLPDAQVEFAKEIQLLQTVATVMNETSAILASPETGPPAIGAETEVIELLLQSRRINPKGGGGGGSSPGGGGTGDTIDSALALLGIGVNPGEVRENRPVHQAVGDSGRTLPEEFRAGLDEYFSRLEHPQPHN